MADEVTATENETTTVETEASTEHPQARTDAPPEVKAALHKANKEAEKLRLRLQEFEDRDKTEAQKLAERADAAEARAADLETRALRAEVAAEKGLSTAQAKRLVGTTREELEADATELLETFKPAATGDRSAITADLDLGARGTPAASGSPEADFAKFLKGQLT